MLNNGKAKEKCHSNVKVIYLFLGRKSNSRIIMKLGYVSLRVLARNIHFVSSFSTFGTFGNIYLRRFFRKIAENKLTNLLKENLKLI